MCPAFSRLICLLSIRSPLFSKIRSDFRSCAAAELVECMAYFPFLRRALLPLLFSITLAACSADSLVPPSSVDSTTHVGAIQPRRALPRTAAPVQYGYQSTTTPVSAASVDYLDTPNLAGVGHVSGGRQVPATASRETSIASSLPPVTSPARTSASLRAAPKRWRQNSSHDPRQMKPDIIFTGKGHAATQATLEA